MIETYLLEQFTAFARCGTLLRAAEELHISQPTLSRSMKKLEDQLGVSLFHREKSKLVLNETGKVAAECAEKVLSANQDLIERVIAFDRGLRTIRVGASSPFPINELVPTLQEYFPQKTILTELTDDEHLISRLKSRQYHLAILHSLPEDKTLFCQRYMEEHLYLSISEDHPIARQDSVSFAQLQGVRILMSGNVGFWMEVCQKHLDLSQLLIQSNPDALSELVEASSLPLFNSDQMMARGYVPPGRKSVPISDADAHATYWLVCLASEQKQYRALFSAVRGTALRG